MTPEDLSQAPVESLLEQAASSPTETDRLWALNALKERGAVVPEGWLERLKSIPEEQGVSVRWCFQKFIGWLLRSKPGYDRQLMGFIRTGLSDKNAGVQSAALEAVKKLTHTLQEDLLDSIVPLVFDPEVGVRHEAASVLLKMRAVPDPALIGIAVALAVRDAKTWDAAVSVLVQLDPSAAITGARIFKAFAAAREQFAALRDYLAVSGRQTFLQGLTLAPPGPPPAQTNETTPRPVHKNGTEAPNFFWWEGERVKLQKKPWNLLDLLWPDKQVSAEDVCKELWAKELPSAVKERLRAVLSRVRAAFKKVKCPAELTQKNQWICLDPRS